jgi:thioredoxin-dependent peroxiredoxin
LKPLAQRLSSSKSATRIYPSIPKRAVQQWAALFPWCFAREDRLKQAPEFEKDLLMRLPSTLTALSLIAVPATLSAALKPGAAAPDFTTQAVLGGNPFPFTLSKALKKGPVVLYFYPKSFTSGCTIEAHEFAEATADFNKAGATVIGISADTIEAQKRFSVEECRNKFAVAVATPAIIKAYDAKLPMMGVSNRTSYVINQDGKIVYTYSNLSAQGHVANTLKAVQGMKRK